MSGKSFSLNPQLLSPSWENAIQPFFHSFTLIFCCCVPYTIQHINLNSTSHLHSHCSSIIHTLLTGHYDPPQHNAHPLGCSESDTHSTSFSSFIFWPWASVMCIFEFCTHFFFFFWRVSICSKRRKSGDQMVTFLRCWFKMKFAF